MENRTRAIITTLTTIVASAATSMMESRLDAMRRFWWQSSGSVDLDHAVLASPRNDLCRCSINGLQKQCTTPCPRSSSVIGGGRGAHDSAGTTRPARRGPSRRRVRTASAVLKNLVSARKDFFNSICQQRTHTCSSRRRGRQHRRPKHSPQTGSGRLSEAEPQSDRGSDVVALEKAESQTAIHLREHDPGIEIPLWCKPPIDSGRDRVERPGALWVLGAEAGGGPPGGGAEERILDIMVIGADHIQIL